MSRYLDWKIERDYAQAMECPVCRSLEAEHARLQKILIGADHRFSTCQKTRSVREYESSQVAASDARLEEEIARLELERHRRIHSSAN